MIEKVKEKPRLVIAGPGAGKTYDMVSEVAEAVSQLNPNRILAVITYTNAAAEMIRGRLYKAIQIPPNIFVGTSHSFFNQFIVMPYATIFEYAALDKLFLEIDVNQIVKGQLGSKYNNHAIRNQVRSRITTKLLQSGKVPLSEIIILADKLMQNSQVSQVVCNRLQYLFIDEFQDADTGQARVFDQIRKGKKTKIYAVGDPEQYILSFTYIEKPGRKPLFQNIPINKFAAQRTLNIKNRRSFSEIVDFTNNFHTTITQKAIKGSDVDSGVFFIPETDLDVIILKYREIIQVLERNVKILEENNGVITRFYLSYENKTFRGYADKYGLTPVSNDMTKPVSILNESLKLISVVTGLNQKQIREKYNLDYVGCRKLGIQLIRAFSTGKIKQESELIAFVENSLNLECDCESVGIQNQLMRLRNLLIHSESNASLHQYTSIHKAKGLEADTVLVVAETKNRLEKWLITDKDERAKDKTDTCRIGFVGFSRAKHILCIACQQKIGDALRYQLSSFDVQVV